MYVKHLIDKALITLEVGNTTALFILLEKGGILHRKGNGNPKTELPLKTGISHAGHFEALMITVNEELFNYTGVINMPGKQGADCQLTLIFQGPNELDFSFRVLYGADSEGPPKELAEVLINAVKLTDAWYAGQLNAKEPEKKWWKLW
jgi:hypothetical protein